MAQCVGEFRHNCIAAGQSSITQQRHVPLYHPPCHQAEVLKELMARCEDIRREKDEAMAALQSVQRDYDLFEVNMQRQGQVRGRGSMLTLLSNGRGNGIAAVSSDPERNFSGRLTSSRSSRCRGRGT